MSDARASVAAHAIRSRDRRCNGQAMGFERSENTPQPVVVPHLVFVNLITSSPPENVSVVAFTRERWALASDLSLLQTTVAFVAPSLTHVPRTVSGDSFGSTVGDICISHSPSDRSSSLNTTSPHSVLLGPDSHLPVIVFRPQSAHPTHRATSKRHPMREITIISLAQLLCLRRCFVRGRRPKRVRMASGFLTAWSTPSQGPQYMDSPSCPCANRERTAFSHSPPVTSRVAPVM